MYPVLYVNVSENTVDSVLNKVHASWHSRASWRVAPPRRLGERKCAAAGVSTRGSPGQQKRQWTDTPLRGTAMAMATTVAVSSARAVIPGPSVPAPRSKASSVTSISSSSSRRCSGVVSLYSGCSDAVVAGAASLSQHGAGASSHALRPTVQLDRQGPC